MNIVDINLMEDVLRAHALYEILKSQNSSQEAIEQLGARIRSQIGHQVVMPESELEQYMQPIFQQEEGYYNTQTQDGYLFKKPSEINFPFFKMLCDYHNQTNFNTPEELSNFLRNKLQGLNMLEIGCGPGFLLPILEDLGAKVCGVDINPLLKPVHRNIHIQDAAIFLQETNQTFDIIYSNDLFCNAILNRDQALEITNLAYEKTMSNGINFHQVVMLPMPAIYHVFWVWIAWMQFNEEVNILDTFRYMLNNNLFQDLPQYNNVPLLDPKIASEIGFKVLKNDLSGLFYTSLLEKS